MAGRFALLSKNASKSYSISMSCSAPLLADAENKLVCSLVFVSEAPKPLESDGMGISSPVFKIRVGKATWIELLLSSILSAIPVRDQEKD